MFQVIHRAANKLTRQPGGVSMRRVIFGLALLLVLPVIALPQSQSIKLRIKAVLVDKELNQKPVPKLSITITHVGQNQLRGPIDVKTGFDGLAEVELPAGRYKLSTPQPVELQNKRFSWSIEFNVS